MRNAISFKGLQVPVLGLVFALLILFPGTHASGIPIQQGEAVHVSDIIDISGVLPPYPQLAYWDGVKAYDSPPSYILTVSNIHDGLENFYVDPAIFATKLGAWYKYDSDIGYEAKGDSLAFVVFKNTTPVTLNTITTTPVPLQTLEVRSILTETTRTLPVTPPFPASNLDNQDYAIIISLITVGVFFGCSLYPESRNAGGPAITVLFSDGSRNLQYS